MATHSTILPCLAGDTLWGHKESDTTEHTHTHTHTQTCLVVTTGGAGSGSYLQLVGEGLGQETHSETREIW